MIEYLLALVVVWGLYLLFTVGIWTLVYAEGERNRND